MCHLFQDDTIRQVLEHLLFILYDYFIFKSLKKLHHITENIDETK